MMAKNEQKVETQTYVLKPGQEHYGVKDDKIHLFRGDDPENNRVELSEKQFREFKDKFVTEASMKELKAKQNELADLQKKQAELEEALKARGISVEDLLAEHTAKKPNPAPSVGTNEPTPDNVEPSPTGSTSDPVNKPAASTQTTPKPGQSK